MRRELIIKVSFIINREPYELEYEIVAQLSKTNFFISKSAHKDLVFFFLIYILIMKYKFLIIELKTKFVPCKISEHLQVCTDNFQ